MYPILYGHYLLTDQEIGKLTVAGINRRIYAYQWMQDRGVDRDASNLAAIMNSMPNFGKKKKKQIRAQDLVKGRRIGTTKPRKRREP